MTDAAFWLCLCPQPAANDAERIVEAARLACLLDTAQRAHAAGFNTIVVHTTAPHLFNDALDRNLIVHRTDPAAPIGAIVAAAARSATGPVCYAGAGMPAMTVAHWRSIHEQIEAGRTVANSLHSADLLAVPDASALTDLADETVDNSFALRLRDESGLEITPLERSAATLFDLDTPADLAMLSLAEATATLEIGPRLSAALAQSEAPLAPARERLAAALNTLTEREQQLMVIGRVGAYVWSALDRDTAARIRIISEERGLRARAAPEERGLRARIGTAPRSLLGLHADAVGPSALIDSLAELADAVIFDTRPLFAHLNWAANRADRFAADLGDPDAIADPQLRQFTKAAVAAPIPIAQGGHSLVSGGLLAAIDIAWTRREQPQHLHPPA